LGLFEVQPFDAGTIAVVASRVENSAVTAVDGGGSVATLKRSWRADVISHISTGGGATLESLEGKTPPGLAALGQH
jgi:phosphoglycerate kinase